MQRELKEAYKELLSQDSKHIRSVMKISAGELATLRYRFSKDSIGVLAMEKHLNLFGWCKIKDSVWER